MKTFITALFISLVVFACVKDELTTTDSNEQVSTRNGTFYPTWYKGSTTLRDNFANDLKQIGFNLDSIDFVELRKSYADRTKNYGPNKPGATYYLNVKFLNGQGYTDHVMYLDTIAYFKYKPVHINKFANINNFIVYRYNPNMKMDYHDYGFGKWKKKFQFSIRSGNITYTDYLPSTITNSNLFFLEHIY